AATSTASAATCRARQRQHAVACGNVQVYAASCGACAADVRNGLGIDSVGGSMGIWRP
ncbi:hypothetical protein U1Q18_048840, partial [Sarracenia purpurea var. burkii]